MAALPQGRSNSMLVREGGPDYAATNGVRREQDGRHLIHFTTVTLREGFTGLQNPVTLKDKWE